MVVLKLRIAFDLIRNFSQASCGVTPTCAHVGQRRAPEACCNTMLSGHKTCLYACAGIGMPGNLPRVPLIERITSSGRRLVT